MKSNLKYYPALYSVDGISMVFDHAVFSTEGSTDNETHQKICTTSNIEQAMFISACLNKLDFLGLMTDENFLQFCIDEGDTMGQKAAELLEDMEIK